MSGLELRNIVKNFGAVEVIRDVSLEVNDGEFVAFVGPSGCGKSTLLRLIAGLDKPTGGSIAIDGKDVTAISAADRGLAMVFQSYALYPHMSVRENLAFGLENTKVAKAEIEARITDAARMLEIEPFLQRRPGQLSGGQRQRVAIGRAIVRRPDAFLLDEPLSNLDAELRVSMRAELAALHARLGATMIYVTHDQVEAMTLADRIVVLRSGRIEQVGTPLELYNKPANRFVAGFIGAPHMNFLEGAIVGHDGGFAEVETVGGHRLSVIAKETRPAGERVSIGIRPQHITLADAGSASRLDTSVTLVEELGSETVVHAEAAGKKLIAVFAGQQRMKSGDSLPLHLDPDILHLFGEDGRRLS
ncbi:ABC transporter ATP-binding protein [Rhizobium laguerreae]|uniref:ABC transporter ATP-binding protein n=1 Tax=Rhizobium laguerreae TaxID=1076926 RepID=UPI001C912CA6|nr:sn-glycerol-3-phosphate ABC transporter ATP-binding protein UgpC [Rhizobium laguerreae]MBY3366187.1 sn-glycerol-3-phosphate ABC transporter ATP-binding protein UgpC [Rhizobium laguerreae]MBY3389819.1 sn-glycerol-3-phosphate ABC transporter ATP-binding protein UgpC [Rhizobium laguerreae]MBY3403570.1 sn-glycerol-3-phosphate ABC transporter ATP-binding protein UgpC [Rhizobium laguerreae]MBY3410509.1 sn-glycerol-3-phosphate ABC transporter ATP-binding protein UgpC [Rhizobium laguerreae]MBY35145